MQKRHCENMRKILLLLILAFCAHDVLAVTWNTHSNLSRNFNNRQDANEALEAAKQSVSQGVDWRINLTSSYYQIQYTLEPACQEPAYWDGEQCATVDTDPQSCADQGMVLDGNECADQCSTGGTPVIGNTCTDYSDPEECDEVQGYINGEEVCANPSCPDGQSYGVFNGNAGCYGGDVPNCSATGNIATYTDSNGGSGWACEPSTPEPPEQPDNGGTQDGNSTTTTTTETSTTTTTTSTSNTTTNSDGSTTTTTTTTSTSTATSESEGEITLPGAITTEDTSSWWESEYPDGLNGIWADKQAAFNASEVKAWLDSWAFPESGSMPSWSFDFNLGFVNFGNVSIEPPIFVWDFIRLCILITALFTARALLFGG